MMSNLRLWLVSALSGGLFCGIVGAIAAAGTSILLPGLGLVVAGPIFAGLLGFIAGSVIGSFIAAIIILTRRRDLP